MNHSNTTKHYEYRNLSPYAIECIWDMLSHTTLTYFKIGGIIVIDKFIDQHGQLKFDQIYICENGVANSGVREIPQHIWTLIEAALGE